MRKRKRHVTFTLELVVQTRHICSLTVIYFQPWLSILGFPAVAFQPWLSSFGFPALALQTWCTVPNNPLYMDLMAVELH